MTSMGSIVMLMSMGFASVRNALFIAGGIMFVADMITLIVNRNALTLSELGVTIGLALLILGTFIGLGLWTKKKPYTALLTGVIVFCAIQILGVIADPSNIYIGIVVKAIVVISLAFWIKQAKRLQQANRISGL